MKKQIHLIILSVLIVSSCNIQKERELEVLTLTKKSAHFDFGDGIFFTRINSIRILPDSYIFLDRHINKIFKTNKNFELIEEFLTVGDGPFEVRSIIKISNIDPTNNSFAVHDIRKKSFLIMSSSGEKLNYITLKNTRLSDGNFSYYNGKLILDPISSEFSEQSAVLHINKEGKAEQVWKGNLSFPETTNYVTRDMFKVEGKFLRIARENFPSYEVFDDNGEVLFTGDLSGYDIFQSAIDKFKELGPTNQLLSVGVINEIVVVGNQIFIQYMHFFENGNSLTKDLAVFELDKGNSLQLTKLIYFQNEGISYYSFGTDGKELLMYSAESGAIDVYELED
ncbi:hypothetical protein [Peijinzhouia sedimentorum]